MNNKIYTLPELAERWRCGIRVDGENHFTIAPRPGGHFRYARAGYDSIYGRVESAWTKENGETVFEIMIPANCGATVRIGEKMFDLTAGVHSIKMYLSQSAGMLTSR